MSSNAPADARSALEAGRGAGEKRPGGDNSNDNNSHTHDNDNDNDNNSKDNYIDDSNKHTYT